MFTVLKWKKDLYFGEQVKRTSGVVAAFTSPCSFSLSAESKHDFKRVLQRIEPSEVQRGDLEDLDEEDERGFFISDPETAAGRNQVRTCVTSDPNQAHRKLINIDINFFFIKRCQVYNNLCVHKSQQH